MPANALDYITVKGFKSIESIDKLGLGPINILIGPNGSGKSNFIELFSFLNAVEEGKLREYVGTAGGAEKLLHFGSKTTVSIFVDIEFECNDYHLHLFPTADDGLFVLDVPMSDYIDSKGSILPQQGREARISDPDPEDNAIQVKKRISSWRVYHLHDTSKSSPMRKTASVNDNRFLRSNGSNLAAYLYYLQERKSNSFEMIQKTIQRVAPFFDSFNLEPLRLNPEDIKLEWRHKNSDQYFDASSLSDGTLRFIALATLFLQPREGRPSLVLVDEPELGLHPAAIELLAALIKQASIETQIIVSTQSSLLLDHFKPEDVLVAERNNGGTTLKRLSSERLAVWLEDYSLGQLWEKNEIGGRPGPG